MLMLVVVYWYVCLKHSFSIKNFSPYIYTLFTNFQVYYFLNLTEF